MIRRIAIALAALWCVHNAAAWAQVSYPSGAQDLSGYATAAQLSTMAASIPTPATTAPPSVSDSGSTGTTITQYALANHTHASKIRKLRALGVNTATYAWTYPTAFGAGVIPICNAIVEDPANSATDSYNVQIVGAPTNTAATFRIVRQSTGLLSLLTGALSLNPTPGTVNLHLSCLEP